MKTETPSDRPSPMLTLAIVAISIAFVVTLGAHILWVLPTSMSKMSMDSASSALIAKMFLLILIATVITAFHWIKDSKRNGKRAMIAMLMTCACVILNAIFFMIDAYKH